jgi:hypothetical protein
MQNPASNVTTSLQHAHRSRCCCMCPAQPQWPSNTCVTLAKCGSHLDLGRSSDIPGVNTEVPHKGTRTVQTIQHLFAAALHLTTRPCHNSVVFTAVTMKNVVFWDIKTQFVLHRRHVSATERSRLMICKI